MGNNFKAFVEILDVLNNNNITYNDSISVLRDVKCHIKQTREGIEYASVEDYYKDRKIRDVGNDVVPRVDKNIRKRYVE